jgi:hypothetical protein
MSKSSKRPSPATLLAVAALVLAMGGGAYAATKIQTSDIAKSAVTTKKIAKGAVKGKRLADSAVATAKIANAAVTSAKLADSAVTAAKIADAAVTSAKLADSAVATAKIADAAVTSAKLADNAVATAKIANAAVTSAKLADSAVTEAKLADGSVSDAKLQHPTFWARVETGTPPTLVSGNGATQALRINNGNYRVVFETSIEACSFQVTPNDVGTNLIGAADVDAADAQRVFVSLRDTAAVRTDGDFNLAVHC